VVVIADITVGGDDRRMRRIAILGFDGAQSLDFVGPLEVFAVAERLSRGRYQPFVVGPSRAPFITGSGLSVTPAGAIGGLRGQLDTLFVAGGLGVEDAARDERLVRAVAAVARRSARVASVCTGAFVLARAGLLAGRRVTTHWASAERLARRHPEVVVEPDRIFVRDGSVWTSAGVTAGMDLALALVEDDLGAAASLEVARWLVLHVRRPGGQAQFSVPLAAQAAERRPLREAQEWVRANPAGDCSVEALAARACMSPRNFSRAFGREVGMTPAAWVEAARVDLAKGLLETTSIPTDRVAAECGFGTPETLRRAFARRVGVSPGQYRERFRTAAA
jgi:transcriptional regulator GlxA family with amidase domain